MSPAKEFRSQLENIMQAQELLFHPTPGFGRYKRFLEHAMAHPAKMNTKLLEFLIKNFTKEGETVLDPMCGSGSTGVIAALCGRNAVQVDIENKFVDWAEEARLKVEKHPTFTPKGSIINMYGDSRKLSELLKEADAVLTSPPYGEAQDGHGIAKEGYQGKKHSPTDLVGNRSYMPDKFQNPRNISNLSYKSYRAAMVKVYSEMWKVLKPSGLCIIVIKPFIRKKKVVDLPYHTWSLLQAIGFKLIKLYKLRHKNPSFWRNLYKKYYSVPEIKHEYILVVTKHG